ncbi:hypothetical protein J6590_101160, partial [Homalodisca vitripennis]
MSYVPCWKQLTRAGESEKGFSSWQVSERKASQDGRYLRERLLKMADGRCLRGRFLKVVGVSERKASQDGRCLGGRLLKIADQNLDLQYMQALVNTPAQPVEHMVVIRMFHCYRLTLNDIQDILEQETDILESEIVIIPNEGVHSDADSGEEDEVDLSRLSRNQLLSSAESSVRKIVDGELLKISIGVPEDISEDDEHFEVV